MLKIAGAATIRFLMIDAEMPANVQPSFSTRHPGTCERTDCTNCGAYLLCTDKNPELEFVIMLQKGCMNLLQVVRWTHGMKSWAPKSGGLGYQACEVHGTGYLPQ